MAGWVEEKKAVEMRCMTHWVGGWVGGWVGWSYLVFFWRGWEAASSVDRVQEVHDVGGVCLLGVEEATWGGWVGEWVS